METTLVRPRGMTLVLASVALLLVVGGCGGAARQGATEPSSSEQATASQAAGADQGMSLQERVDENYSIGQELWKAGRLDDAKDAFLKVLSLDPKHAGALVYLARMARQEGDAARAKAYVERALEGEPKNVEAIRLRVALYRDEKAWDEALRFLDGRVELFKGEDAAKAKPFLTDRLAVLNAKGAYMDVLKEGKKLLLLDPDNADAMREIGRAYIGMHRPGLARYVFREALTRKQDGRIHFFLGVLDEQDGDYKRALVAYTKAVELDPKLAEAYNNLALLNQKAGNHTDAVANLQKALAARPDFVEAVVNLANSYRHLQKFKDAEATYMRAIKMAPNLPGVYFDLGVLYLENDVPGYEKEDRYDLAVKNFSRYRELMGASLPSDDPALKYIKEAQTLKQQVLEMKEQMKLMEQMQEQGGDDGTGADGATSGEEAGEGADAAGQDQAEPQNGGADGVMPESGDDGTDGVMPESGDDGTDGVMPESDASVPDAQNDQEGSDGATVEPDAGGDGVIPEVGPEGSDAGPENTIQPEGDAS